MILDDLLGLFARVEARKQRCEVRPRCDTKWRILVPHRRPVHAVCKKAFAHRAADKVHVLFRKTLAFVAAEEMRDVPEALEVFDQNGIERHVFHPKCFAHPKLSLEIAYTVSAHDSLPITHV